MSGGISVANIVEDQYYLASKAGIPLSESALLPEFEREAFINLVAKEIRTNTQNRIST